jgi:dienelactone hydrolase
MREPVWIFALTLGAMVLLAGLADGARPPELGGGATLIAVESRATLQFDPVPAWALADEITPLRLRGAEPGQVVTLRLRSKDSQGRTWEAHAEFRATTDGRIDVATDVPLSGTYEGADPTGLFWSRTPTDAPPKSPSPTSAAMWQVTAEIAGQTLAAFTQERRYAGPAVTRTPIRAEGLVGTLYTPAGADRCPGVLTLGGSGGGFGSADPIAALLASRGYTTLALAYFGMEGLPKTLDRIPLEYFERALAWLARDPRVDAGRLAVLGGSRGGELALLLGATFPTVHAVVAYVPSGLVFGGYPPMGHAAWTRGGEEVPYLHAMSREAFMEAVRQATTAGEPTDPLSVTLAGEPSVGPATIPVERIQGPVLLISGRADQVWQSERLADVAFQRLQAHAFPHRYEHLRYPDAGHNIGWPTFPTTVTTATHPVSGVKIDFGGTARGTAFASSDSWVRMLRFLEEAFPHAPGRC